MNVEVEIKASLPPTEKDLSDLRFTASRLANEQDSIAVEMKEEDGQFLLIANFKMKTIAQYKVVDRISKEFHFSLACLEGYQDMHISFPR